MTDNIAANTSVACRNLPADGCYPRCSGVASRSCWSPVAVPGPYDARQTRPITCLSSNCPPPPQQYSDRHDTCPRTNRFPVSTCSSPSTSCLHWTPTYPDSSRRLCQCYTPVMYYPDRCSRALLYSGVSHNGGGRRRYLAERKLLAPQQKYNEPAATSWNYGWLVL